MKIRTDFVTNSSSSSYVCEKIATFTLFDKSGYGTNITFQRNDFKFDGDEEFSDGDISVPELFNEFLVVHYKNTQKIASASVLLNSLLNGKKTPMIKEFTNSVGMEDISEQVLYFSVENAQVSSSVGSRLDDEWEEFLKHLNIEYWGIGDYAEFIKAYKAEHRYNFMVFSFGDQNIIASTRFHHGYDKSTEYVFGETKQHFAKESDSLFTEASKEYLSKISLSCNLSKDILEAIEKGDIKVIFFAKDTGVCDEIIWYSGELKKENIRIHLFEEGEVVTNIDDNTDDINRIITEALNTSNKMVKPIDKKEIISKANKEKQVEVIDSLSSDVFDEPGNTDYKVISMTKEEAKGIWTTKKDAMGHLHIVAYKGEGDSTLYIPSEIGGEKIDIVGLSGAYDMISKKRKPEIKRVIIGDGVRYIGRFAFAEMENLQSIVIPPSVTYISPFAFRNTDIRGVKFVSDYSYADSLVDYIGEYTGQFSLEGKSICFIDTDWDYRVQTISVSEYKPVIASLGAIFQQKPNTRTALIVIRDDFSSISDKLNAVLELIQSGKNEIKAITEEKFWNIVNNPAD